MFALVLHDNYWQYMKVNGNSSEIDRKRWIPPVNLLDFIQEKSVVNCTSWGASAVAIFLMG